MINTINRAWIIGLGGLGSAIKKILIEQNIEVNCYSRSGANPINMTCEQSVTELVALSKLPDLIIITTGLLHDKSHKPEKSITQLETDWLNQNMIVNVFPTLFITKALTKRIRRNDKIVIASFSARVSSISDNHLGGWHSYRMSKCMLNMLIKNVAIEWALKSPESTIFGYHPGTVDTPLSKPFQKNIEQNKLFSSQKAAELFWACLSTRTPKHSGKIFDWRKEEIIP